MRKKILKILSVLALILSALEAMGAALLGIICLIVLAQKDTLTSSEVYRELTKMLANYSKFTALGMNGIEIVGFIIFLSAAYVAAAAVGNFICGISGLKAVKGIKIRRARIIGTAALVIGICNITEKIFVWGNGIGAYGILYIAAAALFLYCVNSIKPEKGDKK